MVNFLSSRYGLKVLDAYPAALSVYLAYHSSARALPITGDTQEAGALTSGRGCHCLHGCFSRWLGSSKQGGERALPGEGRDPGAEGAIRVKVLRDELQVELQVGAGILPRCVLALRRHDLVEGAEAGADVLHVRFTASSPTLPQPSVSLQAPHAGMPPCMQERPPGLLRSWQP